jgi:hypothetical protein
MSNINTNAIDTTYPIPGTNNNTQGFRDNFASIKNNIDTAATEITDIQSKAVVKSALTGTSLNNDMANTLISNASVRSLRATTYNLGDNLSGTILINVSKADVHYGIITANTNITFGGWAPTGTQSNVQLNLTIANANATISFPSTVVDTSGNITQGMKSSIQQLENWHTEYPNGAPIWNTSFAANTTYVNKVTAPFNTYQLNYTFSTTDCGTTLDTVPSNRSQRANQIPVRAPLNIGGVGDTPGDTCTDGLYFYVCVGKYDGTTPIWGRLALTGF